jgi:hypothetical protein
MNRDYLDSEASDIVFFSGKEVEHTPAWGMQTLFVVGIQSIEDITEQLVLTTYDTKHIFFGANHSYNPISSSEHIEWEKMITHFLDKDYLCSLDIPINQVDEFNEGCLCEYNNFIPQIRVPIPYIKLWNYNTVIKIDDKDFKASNPGVWSHSLHKLMDYNKFTNWHAYKNDKILK